MDFFGFVEEFSHISNDFCFDFRKDIEAWEEKMIEEKNFHVLRKETIKKLKKDKLIDNDSSNSQ